VTSSREFDGLDVQYMVISERQHGKWLKHRIKESSYSPIIRGLGMGIADFIKPRSYEECEGRGGCMRMSIVESRGLWEGSSIISNSC
jgi:hypothetical protein